MYVRRDDLESVGMRVASTAAPGRRDYPQSGEWPWHFRIRSITLPGMNFIKTALSDAGVSGGSASELMAKARRWHGYASEAHRAADRARSTSSVDWDSDAADAYRHRLHAVACDIDHCAHELDGAADAIAGYARAVDQGSGASS